MKIALLPNLTIQKAIDITFEICSWLTKYGAEFAALDTSEKCFGAIDGMLLKPYSELLNWCDVVISVGGDGSLLNVAKNTVDYDKPILCINAGRLAFMAGLEAEELELLKELINGNYVIDKRMLLDVELHRKGKLFSKSYCINDVVLARGATLKITDIDVICDGNFIKTFRADGIIVATPTGSSAYSLSAGGPIINPSIEAIVVTPIAAQSMFSRSIVFSAENKIEIYSNKNSRNTDLYLSFDGEETQNVGEGDIILITKSDKYAKFIRIKHDHFYNILDNKLAGIERKDI
ncbi:MAG: NAD(+)/NADH kinase [Ruminococcaceae bacterium]|nr:NAD(+)/NADH kinase [Oscillospiraceae bacterium]